MTRLARRLVFLVLIPLVACSAAGKKHHQTPPQIAKRLVSARDLLQRGFESLDRDSLEKARFELIDILTDTNESNVHALYYAALADYRLVWYLFAKEQTQGAETYIEEGLEYLDQAMKIDKQFADAYALYGALLGFEISLKPDKAMLLGMQIPKYFGQALKKDPTNPRVNFLMGTNLLYTPEAFGGGPDNAISYYQKAIRFYDEQKCENELEPCWGKEEAYTQLAIVFLEFKGDTTQAVDLLEKAIEINPRYSYARWKLSTVSED